MIELVIQVTPAMVKDFQTVDAKNSIVRKVTLRGGYPVAIGNGYFSAMMQEEIAQIVAAEVIQMLGVLAAYTKPQSSTP